MTLYNRRSVEDFITTPSEEKMQPPLAILSYSLRGLVRGIIRKLFMSFLGQKKSEEVYMSEVGRVYYIII